MSDDKKTDTKADPKPKTDTKAKADAKAAPEKNDGATLKDVLEGQTDGKALEGTEGGVNPGTVAAQVQDAEQGEKDPLKDVLDSGDAGVPIGTQGGTNPGTVAQEVQKDRDAEKTEDAEKAGKGEVLVTALTGFSHGIKDQPSLRFKEGEKRAVPKDVADDLKKKKLVE